MLGIQSHPFRKTPAIRNRAERPRQADWPASAPGAAEARRNSGRQETSALPTFGIAKLLLEQAGTFLKREEAVKTALEMGMPLYQIEHYLDWLDATKAIRLDS